MTEEKREECNGKHNSIGEIFDCPDCSALLDDMEVERLDTNAKFDGKLEEIPF